MILNEQKKLLLDINKGPIFKFNMNSIKIHKKDTKKSCTRFIERCKLMMFFVKKLKIYRNLGDI